jgi:hypothetical protein
MQYTLCPAPEAVLEEFDRSTDIAALDNDYYKTEPIRVVRPEVQTQNEEDIYTEFEAAISDRQMALHAQIQYLSNPALSTMQPRTQQQKSAAVKDWRMSLFYSAIAVIFTLLGFDLMGILVLFNH